MVAFKWLTTSLIIFTCITSVPFATEVYAADTTTQYPSAFHDSVSIEPFQLPAELDWSNLPAIFMEESPQQENNLIQVFDVAKGKVILSVANSPAFQNEAKKWLSHITSLAPEVQPEINATYIIRVPLQPAQSVNVGHVNLHAAVVFLFYYNDASNEPLLLVFDENKKPYFFHIHEEVKPFLKQLELPL